MVVQLDIITRTDPQPATFQVPLADVVAMALMRPIYTAECVERAERFALVHYETPGHFAPDAVVCLDDGCKAEMFNAAVRRVQYARHGIVDAQRRQRIAAAVKALVFAMLVLELRQGEAGLVLGWVEGIG